MPVVEYTKIDEQKKKIKPFEDLWATAKEFKKKTN